MIRLEHVSKTYLMGATKVEALRDVSLEIGRGEFVAVIGASGSGKSTLMHVLGLLDRPDSGRYDFGGIDVGTLTDAELARTRNRSIGFVFQQFHLLARSTSLRNVELPLIYARARHLLPRALERIKQVGLEKRAEHRPAEMSGGEQQRIAIARALVNDPPIILADEPTGNLDSKNGAEIIAFLKELNRQGRTVVVVTHDAAVAAQFERTITMKDGKVLSDVGRRALVEPACPQAGLGAVADNDRGEGTPAPTENNQKSRQMEGGASSPPSFLGLAAFADHVRQAAGAILGHKMRSFLSVLGILIGVAAVVAILAIGRGARESMNQQLASLGSNLLSVRPGAAKRAGVTLGVGDVTRMTLEDADLLAKLPDVDTAFASVNGGAQLVNGNKNRGCSVDGVGLNYPVVRSARPTAGRFFTQAEIDARERVCVLGTTVVRELFGDSNPVGAMIRINRISFRVIGVLPRKGMSYRDQDDVAVVPVTTAMYRLYGKKFVDAIDVQVSSQEQMASAKEAIKQAIIKAHRLDASSDAVDIRDRSEIRQGLESTTKTMSALLGWVAAISLLVGGTGIMNVMLVTVAERTREIGLRKAIGATRSDIMIQFLVESVVMTLLGGVIGIGLGCGIAQGVSESYNWAVVISGESIFLAAGFSVGVGLLFGLWPAYHASRLNPIDALRHE